MPRKKLKLQDWQAQARLVYPSMFEREGQETPLQPLKLKDEPMRRGSITIVDDGPVKARKRWWKLIGRR